MPLGRGRRPSRGVAGCESRLPTVSTAHLADCSVVARRGDGLSPGPGRLRPARRAATKSAAPKKAVARKTVKKAKKKPTKPE